jgi:hypothetical protein
MEIETPLRGNLEKPKETKHIYEKVAMKRKSK